MDDGTHLNVGSDDLDGVGSTISRAIDGTAKEVLTGVGVTDYGHPALQKVASDFASAVQLARQALTRDAEEYGIGLGTTAELFSTQEDDIRRSFDGIRGGDR